MSVTNDDKIRNLDEKIAVLQLEKERLVNQPCVYGYSRVSSKGQARDGNSLEVQETALRSAGAEYIYADIFTGTTNSRPEFEKLMSQIKLGDTIIVTKLDRMARSVQEGSKLIKELVEKNVAVRILNIGNGPIDNSATGMLMLNILLAFAQFERDMIVQRTQEGKAASGNYGGRNPKFTAEQIQLALNLLESNSYTEVCKMTGISKSTLLRWKNKSDNPSISA